MSEWAHDHIDLTIPEVQKDSKFATRGANNELSEIVDIIKPGRQWSKG